LLSVSTQASADQETVVPEENETGFVYKDERDPFESINRVMWRFNYQFLDRYLYRPAVHAYADYVPLPAQDSVANFVANLDEPFSVVNNLLQGNGYDAANAGGRFLVNTTIGIAGLFDVASHFGWERKQDQFGEVLGVWGVPDGPYLMLPVLGPSTVRDEVGDYVDRLYFPFSLMNTDQRIIRWVLDGFATRASIIDQEPILDNALDPYVFVKEAYYQNIEFRLYDGSPPVKQDDELLEEYLDELE
jgi:phospholipid-binding lipoprotein MlaA